MQVGDLSALEFEHYQGHRVLLGRSGGGLTSFDLVTGRPGATTDTDGQGVFSLCGPLSRGALVMATVDGKVALLDARNRLQRPAASLRVHPHGFAAIDAAGDLIATAGYSGRSDRISLEPSVRVFDVRMGLRMVTSLPFTAGPTLLRFHPSFSSGLLIGSASGIFTLTEATGLAGGQCYPVDPGGEPLLTCDISSSGECIAFGGASGYVHLWSASTMPSIAGGGIVPPMPDSTVDQASLGEEDPFFMIPPRFPPDGGAAASDVGPRETMSVGLLPRAVDPALLAMGKRTDFVTYLDNPSFIRGAAPGVSAAAVAKLRNARLRPRLDAEAAAVERAERAAARAAAGGMVLPGRYRHVVVKHQTGAKFEEFDFTKYNRTSFSGLENNLANCYTNALLQVLFFCPPMREVVLAHAPDPDAEFSLMGELSLLFRMLATAGGHVCQSANLLRALRQSKEAMALGLLEGVRGERGAGDIEVEAHKDRSLVRRMQRFCRFLLEALSKESYDATRPEQGIIAVPSPIEAIFAVLQRQRTKCLTSTRPDQEKLVRTFQVDLQYPILKAVSAASRPSFAQILANSLHSVAEMRAWFDKEVGYQQLRQERVPWQLPKVLVVNCGLEERGNVAWWRPVPMESSNPGAPRKEGGERDESEKPSYVEYSRPWLPFTVAVTACPMSGTPVIVDEDSGNDPNVLAARLGPLPSHAVRAIYQLSAVIAHIMDVDDLDDGGADYEGHLLAHVKVPYQAGESDNRSRNDLASGDAVPNAREIPVYEWFVFNDFNITPCVASEVAEIYDGQKVPVLLFFARVEEVQQAELRLPKAPTPVLSADAFLRLCRAPPTLSHTNRLHRPTFIPLEPHEIPRPGQFFALDAEFVAYSSPERIVRRGVEIEARPPRLGLGRVSIVRGDGPNAGVPCVDDYIRSIEPVYDHLTKYSGLSPGDLDPTTSRHYLTTLRRAYLKLRYMVDAGVIFVGHGLTKDFRMLNIVVPAEQIIDTVDIFHTGRGRRLSLRFLASFLLGTSIQGGSHDSVEDAVAALRLYREYLRLKEQCNFDSVLKEMYEWGGAQGWDPLTWTANPPRHDAAGRGHVDALQHLAGGVPPMGSGGLRHPPYVR